MKKTLKTVSIIQIIIGSLAVIGWAGDPTDGFALVGGLFILGCGITALSYIKENAPKLHKD